MPLLSARPAVTFPAGAKL